MSNQSNSKSEKHRLRNGYLYFKSFAPLLLSHHPQCDKFKNHTLNIKNVKLCIGCFIGYPSAILSLIFIITFNLNQIIAPIFFLLFGLTFLSTFILSPLHLTEHKFIKIIQKALIGNGAILILYWIIALPNPIDINIFIMYITGWGIFTVMNAYHVLGNMYKCYKCETPLDWNNCGGFEGVKTKMEQYNLKNIFENMDEFSQNLLKKKKEKN